MTRYDLFNNGQGARLLESDTGAWVKHADAQAEYERGRLTVRRELTEALSRFNEDDSLGMGDLLHSVVEPFLLDEDEQDA